MGSRIVSSLLVVAVMALAGSAGAGVPDPVLSTVPNVLASPAGTMAYTVTVVSTEGPVDQALVQLAFSTEAAGIVCWCTGQTQPLIEATSNVSGIATFFISAGGCVNPALVTSPPVVEVFANGIKLKEVGVVNVDAVDDAGLLPTDGGYAPGAQCAAGLSDVVYHTNPIKNGAYDFCTDLDSDFDVDLDDAVAVTPGLSSGWACTAAP